MNITENDLSLKGYNYNLPPENIAQYPADRRDNSRLLVLRTTSGEIEHRRFKAIADLIDPRDMLVMNNTRVFPARLIGQKETGGKAEVFLLNYPKWDRRIKKYTATALVRSSKRPRPDSTITINATLSCTVNELLADGKVQLLINCKDKNRLEQILQDSGQVPLPPYISRKKGTTPDDLQRYQTVYAEKAGAVAAPTAGLHFTHELMDRIRQRGTRLGTITLHVGYGTFAPVRTENIEKHTIHSEYIEVPEKTVEKILQTKADGGKIWAVGTTTVRALEFSAQQTGSPTATKGWCDLYIYPGFPFRVIDNLITNFHLPDSSLMFLVSALCGRKTLLECYKEAIRQDYRFYSYGDAMAIVTNSTGQYDSNATDE
ncbi:tRNA preQ1(34) S-adenosylmethionine ribosyltransferase-isomerase QueA [Desulfomarina sp.]